MSKNATPYPLKGEFRKVPFRGFRGVFSLHIQHLRRILRRRPITLRTNREQRD